MTTAPESRDFHPVDRHARQAHAAALAQVSPDTLARLRRARQAATAAPPRRHRLLPGSWLAGGALAATVALAVVLLPGTPTPTAPAPAAVADVATVASDLGAVDTDLAETLQEDPNFYVWLGSLDSNALAME